MHQSITRTYNFAFYKVIFIFPCFSWYRIWSSEKIPKWDFSYYCQRAVH